MIRKKLKIILAALLIMNSILIVKNLIPNKTIEQPQQTVIQLDKSKVVSNEIIIENIKDLHIIELYQISFNKKATISTGDKLTKKTQDIIFKGSVINKLDLSQCTIEVYNNNIKIYIKDYNQTVEFFENKTTYSETDKSLLAFGDIKITPSQYEEIKYQIKGQLLEESKTEIQNLNTKASEVISDTLKSLTNKSYDVRIVRVGE